MVLRDKWILLVDDEEGHLEAVSRSFKGWGNGIRLTVSRSLSEARQQIEEGKPDLVIADWLLPDGKGSEIFFPGNRELFPVIIMTSHGNEALAVEMMKAGAVDYVVKSEKAFRDMPQIAERALSEWENGQKSREADRALREDERKFRELAELLPEPVFQTDEKGKVTFASASALKVFGFTKEDLEEGIHMLEVFAEPERELIQAKFQRAQSDREPQSGEFLARRKDGTTFPVFIHAGPILHEGRMVGVRGIVVDVTAQKKAEEALYHQVSFLRSLVEAIPNPVFFKDVEGKYLGCNEAYSKFYGLPRQQMVGKSIEDLVPKEVADLHRKQDIEVLTHREMRTYEAPAEDAQGISRRLLLYKAPFFNVDGSAGGVIGVIVDITEREEALAALRTSEANLAEAQRIAHLGSWDWNPQTKELFCSAEVHRIFGFCEGCHAPTSEKALEVVHPDDRALLQSAVKDAVRTHTPLDIEHRILMPDRSVRFVRQRAEVLYGEDGQPIHVTGTSQDITQAKELERELEASRQSFASIVENSTDAILVVDAEGYIVYANPAATSIFGRARDELLGSFFGVPLTAPGAVGRPIEIEIVRPDRNPECAEMRAVPTTWNGREARLALFHDVTDRKRYDEALKLSEEKMRVAIESSPIGTKIVQDGKYHYVNPAFVLMFGYQNSEEILERPVESLYVSEDSTIVRQQEQASWEGMEAPYFYERRGFKKDGTVFDVSVWLKKIEFGGVPSILGFAIDMSREKTLRAQLLQAQKMEALGTLSGGIAHDFNNILTIVSGYTELLLSERSEDSADKADLQRIATAAARGTELVQRMLAFSRRAEWKPHPLNLNELVAQVVKLLSRTIPKMIDVKLELADQLAAVLADGGQIEQVLVNLALNARDAMPDGGKLTFQTRIVRLDESYITIYPGLRPGDHVVLSVSDTGAGMDSDTVEHIFDPFFTTKGPGRGTGLGLAVVYGIVKQHNGAITCYSQPGEGTTFNIYLPAIEAGAELPEEPVHTSLQSGNETILLVDDEQFIRDLGERILAKAGYRVITAASGREALEIYSMAGTRISLVILDLVMPEMGGRQCLREILGMDPRAKVLIASGLSGEASRRVVEAGAKGYVSKPYDMNLLVSAVRQILDSEE